DALDRGDVLTATEYIHLIRQGHEVAETEQRPDVLAEFFPDAARRIDEFMEDAQAGPQLALRNIRGTTSFAGIDMSRGPGAQAEEAAAMLEAWFAAKRAQAIHEPVVRRILSPLGFEVQTATVRKRTSSHRPRSWVDVTTAPVRDRNRCPLAAFGSEAGGR